MIKIALSGANGKMGRVLASIIKSRQDCTVVCGFDPQAEQYDDFVIYEQPDICTQDIDVIIDFSHPNALNGLLEYCSKRNIPLVLATTGYSDEQKQLIAESSKTIPIFFTFNMSLGINLLVELCKTATAVLGNQFDVEIVEKHHNQKIDAPSGTAYMLADAVNEVKNNSCRYVYERQSKREKRESDEIGIHSVRGRTIVGEHSVIFAGRDEVIELSHSAFSKEVFAVGAVNAAVYMYKKAPGLYNMGDVIKI